MSVPRVEFVYFPGCPHADTARMALRAALAKQGLPIVWQEWNRDDPATPRALRRHGSPSILIDGHDIAPSSADASACRVYLTRDGLTGAPDVDMIRAALRHAATRK